MPRPVVIVDPLSSGIELAPTFKKRGLPVIAVTFEYLDRLGFGTKVQTSDFIEIVQDHPGIAETLREYDPFAIIPGTESAIPLVEELTKTLTPHLANDPEKSMHRQHKALMQEALHQAGVPTLKTLNTSSEIEVEAWIKENDLKNTPLIIKPPLSAGSDKVFHISAGDDWKTAVHQVLTEPSKITGDISKTAIIQEQAIGTEFAVGTVSANGKHYLSHLIKYNKISYNGRKTVYDHVEFIPYSEEKYGELFDYTQKSLDALGLRWGAAHNEVMLTEKGPRLIETGARMLGGPTVGFSREATGSSQADKLVDIYTDSSSISKTYNFKKTVVPVFLKSPYKGTISNVEALEKVSQLPTLLSQHIWLKNGDLVPKTVDYLTALGIVALSGDREAIFEDYKKIRDMESQLRVKKL